MNKIKSALLWPFQFADYVWFVVFMGMKLYVFGKFTGLAFPSFELVKVTAGSVFLASFWALPLPRRGRMVVLWALGFALSFTIFADLVYYRYFGDFLTVPVIMQAGQAGSLGGSIASLTAWKDIVFFLDLVAAVPLLFLLRRRSPLPWSRWTVRTSLSLIAGCIGFALVYMPIKSYTTQYGKNLFVNNWWNVSIYNVTGLLGFHYFDAKKYINERLLNNRNLSDEELNAAKEWFEDRRNNRADNPLFGTQQGNNVLIVQAEAFQNFFIGKSVNGKEITPNLNRLAKEIAYFDNFYHQVGQGRTVDAEFLVNQSLYPLPTGAVYREYPTGDYDSLPKVLKSGGYSTYAFHAFKKSFWNRHVMYEQYGLDYFYGIDDFAPGEKVGWDLGDESMFNQMVDALLEKPKPFYALAVTLSSHHPFTNIPRQYKELDVGELEGSLEGNYLHAVHYVDYAVGKLIDRLKEEGLWDNTIVAFYGDHDAALVQNEKVGELLGFDVDELALLEMKHEVPLFLHLPGAEQPGTHSKASGMIDMTPTLLELLGISIEDKYFMGGNLFDKQDEMASFRNGSFTDGKVFYKASLDGVFDNGVCMDIQTRQPTDLNACKAGHEETINRLRISDDTITFDLLKIFKK